MQRKVELIREVRIRFGGGPGNGMAALQKLLRQRIAQGLNWLSIQAQPTGPDVLPWFWHWGDRQQAVEWNAKGLPFVEGPNMLFINSRMPRIDVLESALLDAAHCRAMFCHSEWYRDMIAKHRGPANQSPIVLWPYPIDPWPEGPTGDKYDLLIYVKNGVPPGLPEYLANRFQPSILVRYGSYRREELYDTACNSRACVYLADDDHGPLALEEILLSGCPVVGVRTGAPWIQPGQTGLFVDRLPPGQPKNDEDQAALTACLEAIQTVQTFSRSQVRTIAAQQFDNTKIVDCILAALESCRKETKGIT